LKDLIKKIFKIIMLFPINVIAFIEKDAKLILRKRKYLYISILLPLILGSIYILSLEGASNNIDVIVCDLDNTYLTKDSINKMTSLNVDILTDDCVNSVINGVKNKKYLFGMIIPKGFTNNIENLKQTNIEVYYDNSEPATKALASWRIDSALIPLKYEIIGTVSNDIKEKSTNAKEKTKIALDIIEFTRIPSSLENTIKEVDDELNKLSNLDENFMKNPIVSNNKGVHEEYDLIDIGISPLYVILSLFMILMLCSTGVIYDKKIGLFSRIKVSNASNLSYIFGKLIFYLIISLVQLVFLLIIFYAFGANFSTNFLLLFKAFIYISLTNTLIGFLIGLISENEGAAVLISLIITLPMLFLSGMFYPLQLMPKLIQFFTRLFPVHTEIDLLNKALLFGGNISLYVFLLPLILLGIVIYMMRK
jgi:ABC-2 type transport system permease protein